MYEDNFCSNVSAANNIDSLRCRNVTYRGNVFMNCRYVGILVNVGNGIVGGHEQYTMPIDGVDVTDWAARQTLAVSWSGGVSWGDLGADFTVKNHAIVDEAWGD